MVSSHNPSPQSTDKSAQGQGQVSMETTEITRTNIHGVNEVEEVSSHRVPEPRFLRRPDNYKMGDKPSTIHGVTVLTSGIINHLLNFWHEIMQSLKWHFATICLCVYLS